MSTNDPDKDIREQAALWAERMTDPVSPPGAVHRERFQSWLLADERHVKEFRATLSISALAAELPQSEQTRLNAWAAQSAVAVDTGASHRRHFLKGSAIAASVVAATVMGGVVVKSQGWFGESYATSTGESRVVTFEEGSVAYLNTRTEVRWVGNVNDRRVELVQGEALFDVVHDPSRPFRVTLDDSSEIIVTGTRFNVYRKPSGETIVTVLEGNVEVRGGDGGSEWVRPLHADQQIEYRPIGLVHEPHDTVSQNAVSWRSGVLKFDDTPVQDVVEQLARYTDQRIRIRDPRVATEHVAGLLSARDVRSALMQIQAIVPAIEVKESDGAFILDYRPAPTTKHED